MRAHPFLSGPHADLWNISTTTNELIYMSLSDYCLSIPEKRSVEPSDEKWISKLCNLNCTEIAALHFSVEFLSEKMGVSSRQLSRNVKSKLGITTCLLIQYIRLEKAKRLLQTRTYEFEGLSKEIGITNKLTSSKSLERNTDMALTLVQYFKYKFFE